MMELVRRTLTESIRLQTVLAREVWLTHADTSELENALLNLAVNAKDAMPDGGKLTIETSNTHLDEAYSARHPGVSPGAYVAIAITDTGTGMTPGVLEKAFDPFFTTKPVGQGTGLGLSQVYGFVRQSNGHIKAYSEPGHGTTVRIYLPRFSGERASTVSEPPDSGEMPVGRPSEVVLVTEDDERLRRLAVDMLRELGYTVLHAGNAAAALRHVETGGHIDLLFTDIVMPEMNGRKLAQEARRGRPELRVLFTTGFTRDAVICNGIIDAGVDVIIKPYTIEHLARKVREILDRPPGPVSGYKA